MDKDGCVPKVGVVLLTYNQGKYIKDAIESLKKQTFQDFEVVLVDDSSNDNSTLKELEKIEYEKITKRFLHKDNAGSTKRREYHDRLMKNKYIFNFDGDDILEPEFLEKTVDFLDKKPDYGAVCTNIRLFRADEDKSNFYFEKKYDKRLMKIPDMLVNCNMLGTSLLRKEALESIKLDWPLRRFDDWNRCIAMLEKGWKLGLVEEPLFYYRQVDDSLSHSPIEEDGMSFIKELVKRYPEEFKKYYKEIIYLLYEKNTELQGGKDWLEKQYYNLNKEIDRLNNVVDDLNREISILRSKLEQRGIKKYLKKIIKK